MTFPRRFLALAVVISCAAAAWAGRVDMVIPLGGTATAAVAAPGAHVTIGFLVTQGTGRQLAFQFKRAKGSTLVPQISAISPDGKAFDFAANGGSATPSSTSWKAKLPDVTQTGLWRLEVSGANQTTGGFTLSIKGKDVTKTTASAAFAAGETSDVSFVAGDNVAVTVTTKRANGSLVVPKVVIIDPSGVPVGNGAAYFANSKTGAIAIKALRLPLFGKYTLRFSGTTNVGGGLTCSVATAAAVVKGKLPTANPGPSFEGEPAMTGQLDGTASTAASGGVLSYRWTQVSGPTVQLTNPTSATPTFLPATAAASVAFELSVSEDGLLSRGATVAVEIARRPVVDAGRSQSVAASSTVTLDGTGSFDRKGAALTYLWRQIPGDATAVTLTGANTATPSFTAPAGASQFHFGLVVDNGVARSFEDVVNVVSGDPTRSVADAGREQFVRPMSGVHLSGLATRSGSGVLDGAITWTQVSGPSVVLADATTPWPSFTAPVVGVDLVFAMTINGASGVADRTTVHVRTSETNLAPPAKAFAPAIASAGQTSLSATSTVDPDADALTFQWGQMAGAGVAVSNSNKATATAAIPVGSDQYVFAVQANDGLAYGAPDVVSVRSQGYVGRPIASAGPNNSANPGVVVTLDGTGSVRTDGVNAPLTYAWTQIGGNDFFDVAANTPTFDPTAARPSFALPIDFESLCPTQVVLFQLVVDDGAKTSLPDLVAVTFTNVPTNGKPSVTAGASDTNPVVGQTVTLFGTVSDRDGDQLNIGWKQTSGPTVQLLPNATTLSPTFVAPAQGSMAFQLVGHDGTWDSAPANVTVTVDRKPVAAIVTTPSSAGAVGTPVTMDGSTSSDPEGHTLAYTWTQTAGASVIFGSSGSSVQFAAPAGTVTFRLVVSDGRQNSDPATASFATTLPAPSPASNASGGAAPYGATVSLTSNPGSGGPFTFTWRQINPGGTDPSVSISSLSAQNPTFSVPLPTTAPFGTAPSATFGVIYSDGVRTSPEGTVTVNFYASLNATTLTSNTVYSIISTNCTSCHSGSQNTCPIFAGYEYGMGTVTAFLTNSRGVTACSSSKSRLPTSGTTGSSSNAFLLDRLKGISSSTMPPFGSLSGSQIRLIQDWIDQGSQNN